MIAAIDPGLCTGFCLLDTQRGSLWCYAGAHDDLNAWLKIRQAASAIIERPAIYPKQKARPADIITLALRAGEAAGRFACSNVPVRYVEPAEWKRQIPKEICEGRIRALLTPLELSGMDACLGKIAAGKRNNAVDAVGLALFMVGRRVF